MGASAQVQAQREANNANLQITDKNNDSQIALMREQNEWNLHMWELENQYNDPAAQRQRLEDAGLNPLLLDGWNSGNAVSPPQSLGLPTLQQAHVMPEWSDPQIKAGAFQQIAGAFKNLGEFTKSLQESGIESTQLTFLKDMALKGFNPELIKARTSLELYNQLITSGKYQLPQIEAIIRGYNARSNYDEMAAAARKEEVNKIREEYEGIKFTNKFNKDKAPLELARLYSEVRDIYLGTDIKASVAQAQINAADASANLSNAQATLAGKQGDLIDEQAQGQRLDNAVKRFRAGLADIGINPDDKHLPFFFGIGQNIVDKKLDTTKVAALFESIGKAENIGWNSLVNNGSDLSKFQLYGEPNGPLGIFPILNSGTKDIYSIFENWLKK